MKRYHFGMEVTVIKGAMNLESDAKNVVHNQVIHRMIQYIDLRMKL